MAKKEEFYKIDKQRNDIYIQVENFNPAEIRENFSDKQNALQLETEKLIQLTEYDVISIQEKIENVAKEKKMMEESNFELNRQLEMLRSKNEEMSNFVKSLEGKFSKN